MSYRYRASSSIYLNLHRTASMAADSVSHELKHFLKKIYILINICTNPDEWQFRSVKSPPWFESSSVRAVIVNEMQHLNEWDLKLAPEWTRSPSWAVHPKRTWSVQAQVALVDLTCLGLSASAPFVQHLLNSFCNLPVKRRPPPKLVWAVLHQKKTNCHLNLA